jgi:hypothetical protein
LRSSRLHYASYMPCDGWMVVLMLRPRTIIFTHDMWSAGRKSVRNSIGFADRIFSLIIRIRYNIIEQN